MSPADFLSLTLQEFFWIVAFKNKQANPRPYGVGRGAMTQDEVEELEARMEARQNNGG